MSESTWKEVDGKVGGQYDQMSLSMYQILNNERNLKKYRYQQTLHEYRIPQKCTLVQKLQKASH